MHSNLLYSNDKPSVYPQSWYSSTVNLPPLRPPLAGSINSDVCIIGAGFTGLSAALYLSKKGFNVVVLDAHRAGWGASGRNGGQLGSGQRVDQDELEAHYGLTEAKLLWELAQQSKALVKELLHSHKIDCDYEAGVIHADHKSRYSSGTESYVHKLQTEYGYRDVDFVENDTLCELLGTDVYYSGSVDIGAGHLHPLKYALGLSAAAIANGVTLYEGTAVTDISSGDPATIKTSAGEVVASHVLMACNGYLGSLQPEVGARVMPINNYIIATAPLPMALDQHIIPGNMAVSDSRFVVNYFRKSADHRLLFGGRESYGYQFPADIKGFVQSAMLKIYPQLKEIPIDYGWGGTLAITLNRMPHLRALSSNVISASGYSGHGVGMATLSGRLAGEFIAGNLEQFDVLQRITHRKFPGGMALRSPLMKLGMLYYSLRDLL